MDAAATVKVALNLARSRLAELPTYPVYSSIVTQLEYLVGVLDGTEKNRTRLKDIMIGRYGAMEFEETDPEFARALMAAQFVATKMLEGLKV